MSRGVVTLSLCALLTGCDRPREVAATTKISRPTEEEVWAAIQPLAARYQMEPGFIYAIVVAESGIDPRARNGAACGLMQLKPGAWRMVSAAPFEPTVWDWRENLAVGVDYLAYVRSVLHQRTTFSYPRLVAAFHYGLDYVEARKFEMKRLPVPDSPIYQRLWAGDLTPVAPP